MGLGLAGFGVGAGGSLLGGVDSQLRADLVEVIHHVLHAVIGLRN